MEPQLSIFLEVLWPLQEHLVFITRFICLLKVNVIGQDDHARIGKFVENRQLI